MIPFEKAFSEKTLIFDGSMGVRLRSEGFEGELSEQALLTCPELVRSIHESYIQSGADVVITNSLGTTPAALSRHGLAGRAAEITALSVSAAKEASAGRAYVALDVGSTGEMLAPYGAMEPAEMLAQFRVPIKAGMEAGADFVLVETMTDLAEARLAVLAARELGAPVVASFSFQKGDRTMTGATARSIALTISAMGACGLGINCSTGPEDMITPLLEMRAATSLPIVVQPNAGMPELIDGAAHYRYDAKAMAQAMVPLLQGGATSMGGCCGTTPEHIRAISALPRPDSVALPRPALPHLCSSRESWPLADALKSVEPTSPDEDFDLPGHATAARIDLAGLTPKEAAELVAEMQISLALPVLFCAKDSAVLESALMSYVGIAAAYAPGVPDAILQKYGAVRVSGCP